MKLYWSMTRPLRILFENAWYHLINRGASRTTVFHENDDYKTFLRILSQVHRRYRFETHAYCLMPNHYHIITKTPIANLSHGMRHLNGLYTQYYNKKYKKDGALFRGRYKAILIDADNYLLRLSRYIHLNPVKAHLAKHPKNYHWSSFKYFSENIAAPDWLYTKTILNHFGTKQQKNQYSLFVMENTDNELENFYRKIKLLPVLGTAAFRKQISNKYLDEQNLPAEIKDHKNICKLPELRHICQTVSEYYREPIEIIYNVDRARGNRTRAIAIYLAAELSGKKFKTIADFFKNTSHEGISKTVSRINKLQASKLSLAKDIDNLRRLLLNYSTPLLFS
jgi:putative transposase